MRIRRLRTSDYDELADLIEQWKPEKARRFRMGTPYAHRGLSSLVAIGEGSIVGWLEGTHRSPFAWHRFHDRPEDGGGVSSSFIEFLFVEDGNRRRNFGSALLMAFESQAEDYGNDFIALSLDSVNNTRAKAFYRAHGYSRSKSSFYGHLMGKAL